MYVIDNNQKEQEKLLEIAENYFRLEIAPKASIIDGDSAALKTALQGMGLRALLALQVPKSWGGAELSEMALRHFQMAIARYSGALAFLQTQHQSAARQIASSRNEALKREYLPKMGNGKVLLGVGFSHLRRRGEPLLLALPCAGGYNLQGQIPWITGYGFFQDVVIGATLPDGRVIYCIVPFKDGKKISFSQPMDLIAMASTNTVSALLDGLFLESNSVLAIKSGDAIHENDKKNVLHHSFFALGCALAALDILESIYTEKQLLFIKQAFDSLTEELNTCREAIFAASEADEFAVKLELRAFAINLACRCSQAAVTAASGAANYKYNAAGRVYREALMFTVSGQTTSVMEATLKQLLSGN